MTTEKEGYKDHRAGSNKGKVHQVYDEKGAEAAIKKAVSLDIKEATARTWCSSWKTGAATKKAAKAPAKSAKKVAKKTAKKAKSAKRVKSNGADAHA